MKKILTILALLSAPVVSYPQDAITDAAVTNAGGGNVVETNRLSGMLLMNSILPGSAQLALGKTSEGALCMASWPLILAGNVIALYYLFTPPFSQNQLFITTNGNHYIWYNEAFYNNSSKWMFYCGMLMAEFGGLLYEYSQYDARREIYNRCGYNPALYQTNCFAGGGLADLMAAPWKPENVFNWDVFPVLPLLFAAGYSVNDWQKLGTFFSRCSVGFLGMQVHPAAGMALVLASALLLNTAVAPFEETANRGSALINGGQICSSVCFGLLHTVNAFFPNTSLEDTLRQTVFAALYGFYASQKTLDNHFDFQRMIAFHFWFNTLAMTLDYMIDPDHRLYFEIWLPFIF